MVAGGNMLANPFGTDRDAGTSPGAGPTDLRRASDLGGHCEMR